VPTSGRCCQKWDFDTSPCPSVSPLASLRTSAQNDTLALSCSSRGGVIAIVIVPNCGVLTNRFGVPRLTILETLNASPRNSSWRSKVQLVREKRRSGV